MAIEITGHMYLKKNKIYVLLPMTGFSVGGDSVYLLLWALFK